MAATEERAQTLRGAILLAFGLALGCYLAWLLRAELLLLYVSALFAVVLRPLVEFIAGFNIRGWRPFRKSAIIVLIFAVIAGLVLFVYLALPPVLRDLRSFAQELPSRLPEIQAKLQKIPFADQIDAAGLVSQAQGALTQSASFVLLSI